MSKAVALQVARQALERGPFLLIAFPQGGAEAVVVSVDCDGPFWRTRLDAEWRQWKKREQAPVLPQ